MYARHTERERERELRLQPSICHLPPCYSHALTAGKDRFREYPGSDSGTYLHLPNSRYPKVHLPRNRCWRGEPTIIFLVYAARFCGSTETSFGLCKVMRAMSAERSREPALLFEVISRFWILYSATGFRTYVLGWGFEGHDKGKNRGRIFSAGDIFRPF